MDQKLAAVEISFLAKSQHVSRPPGSVRDPIDDIAHQAKFCAPPGCSRAAICCFLRLHEFVIGTVETCRPTLRMSANRGRPEVIDARP